MTVQLTLILTLKQNPEKLGTLIDKPIENHTQLITDIRKIRDVPYRGLIMQAFQILIAISIATLGLF